MHIQAIVISGFKSYRDTVKISDLSPGHNVVVGRNGSGKSNFFDAIRFLLSDAYTNLRNNERQALLHEGVSKAPTAFVEITFDNSDGRLPFDKDQVTLRRIISQTKDEYVLDKKNVTRTEVFNLLETAGFSKSNPYYIVQQGRISALCSMKDEQRLQLLEEVAGTKLYDERREESLKILQETATKRTRILEVVKYLEERMSELETEKEELKKLEELETERRSLEYTLYITELEEIKESLEQLEADRQGLADESEKLYETKEYSSKRKDTLEQRVEDLEQQVKLAQFKLHALREQYTNESEKEARLKVSLTTTEDTDKLKKSSLSELQDALREASQRENECRHQLQNIQNQLDRKIHEEMDLEQRINEIEQKVLRMHSREQGRSKFSSVQERDTFLQNEIQELEWTLTETKSSLTNILEERQKVENDQNTLKEEEKNLNHEIRTLNEELKGLQEEVSSFQKQRNALQLQKQELWRQENEYEQELSSIQKDISKKERDLCYACGAKIYAALEILDNVLKDKPNLRTGFYGPLYTLFTVDDKFSLAVEVAAGQSLSFVVVENHENAAALVQELQRVKGGRLTFVPLQEVEPKQLPALPPTQDAFPILNKIVPKQTELYPALQAVFGSTLVARSISVAASLSREYNVNCVTLDGDTVNKTGAMAGGYSDQSRSRLKAFKEVQVLRENLQKCQEKLQKVKDQLKENETQLNQLSSWIQKSDVECYTRSSQIHDKEECLSKNRQEQNKLQEQWRQIHNNEDTLAQTKREIETAISLRKQELGTPLVSTLTLEEQRQTQDMESEKMELFSKLQAIHSDKMSLEQQLASLNAEVDEYLYRKIASLRLEIQKLKQNDSDEMNDNWLHPSIATKEDIEAEHRSLLSELSSIKNEIEMWEEKLDNFVQQENEMKEELETLRQDETKSKQALDVVSSRMEQLYLRRAKFLEKKSSLERSIVSLGSLPANFHEYRSLSRNILEKRMQRNQNKLKKFTHVNRKALDQYRNFTEQREALGKRLEELEKGDSSIRQLIETLDNRKDEDISRTFRTVREHFSKLFDELVPGGKARLEKENENPQNSEREPSRPLSFAGVSIEVSFPGSSQVYLLEQLSGGQKSIVALALIFAIQFLDPAPFYLFDEIDANLDSTFRKAVSRLLQTQSQQGTQFITTTFRPEFLFVADKCFGVSQVNKISSIQEVSRDDALLFVGSEETEISTQQ
ncbi:Structural maintenance of chromosomes protein 3 [Galdieria sulphuraria]|nr:Structural maintenance of chromosomes protein 3 [Galdieria sulphuraria]